MGQFIKLLLAIDIANTVQQKALDCRLSLGGINQVDAPNRPTRRLDILWQVINKSDSGMDKTSGLSCSNV